MIELFLRDLQTQWETAHSIMNLMVFSTWDIPTRPVSSNPQSEEGWAEALRTNCSVSLLVLSGEFHTSTASQLSMSDCGCCFFCSIGPVGTVKSTHSFLLIVSAGHSNLLGNSDPCVLFLFSPSFHLSQRNYTGVLSLLFVVSLLYSNFFFHFWKITDIYKLSVVVRATLNIPVSSWSAFPVRTWTYGLKKWKSFAAIEIIFSRASL